MCNMSKEFCLSYPLKLIAGVDESGCGSLVGSVIASAVVFHPERFKLITGLADSKVLSSEKRVKVYTDIIKYALAWSIGIASVEEIDRLNILQARLLAMKRAICNLSIQPNLILIDGKHAPLFDNIFCQCFIRGDAIIPIISAASIIAKVVRDLSMVSLDKKCPEYGFLKNKGYPTQFHLKQLKLYGPSLFHRKSFAPIKYMLKYR